MKRDIITLYGREVEHWDDFDQHPDREYFLANTRVIASAKSVHILTAGDEDVATKVGTHA